MSRKIKEIRRINLISLINECEGQLKLCELIGTPQAYISQIVTKAKTKNGTVRGIGDDIAERLEVACKKPQGWMDIDHRISVKDNGGDYEFTIHPNLLKNLTPTKLKTVALIPSLSDDDSDIVYAMVKTLTEKKHITKKIS